MDDMRLSDRSVIEVAEGLLATELAGEVMILDLRSGIYYGLNAVAARVWALLQGSRTVREIRDGLVATYQVEPERCEGDLVGLLRELASVGLVQVREGGNCSGR